MNEKIYLDTLTSDSVSLRRQQYVIVDGIEYPVGAPWGKAYRNSESGRAEVHAEMPEPYLSAIMAVWGAIPTVIDKDEISVD
jgi:hypothetical protein